MPSFDRDASLRQRLSFSAPRDVRSRPERPERLATELPFRARVIGLGVGDPTVAIETSVEIVRRVTFCAGHRIRGHESKCRNIHGHNYTALFHAAPRAGLDMIGRVIDFAVLKELLGGWIDEYWDHGLLLWEQDADAIAAAGQLAEQKLFLLPSNPTAENLAYELLHSVAPKVLADTDVIVTRVVLWETENCYAEVALRVW